MSTNPFRQIRAQQDPATSSTHSQFESVTVVSDAGGLRSKELSVDTRGMQQESHARMYKSDIPFAMELRPHVMRCRNTIVALPD